LQCLHSKINFGLQDQFFYFFLFFAGFVQDFSGFFGLCIEHPAFQLFGGRIHTLKMSSETSSLLPRKEEVRPRRDSIVGGASGYLTGLARDALCGKRSLDLGDVTTPDVEPSIHRLQDALNCSMGALAVTKSLAELWEASLGAVIACPASLSKEWQLLGFQGSDPSRDLRSTTYPLALKLATHFLRSSPAVRREALLSATGSAPPFALCVLNTLQMLACHLKLLSISPPAFCPCCGSSIREKEYGKLANQSHRGASLQGFVELVREAALGTLSRGELSPGELALGELVSLVVRRLGMEWRRQGRESRIAEESEESLLTRLRQSVAGCEARGVGDTRLMGFPAMLSSASVYTMASLSFAAQRTGGQVNRDSIRRSRSEASGAAKGGGYAAPDQKWASASVSPIITATSAVGVADGEQEDNKVEEQRLWGGIVRKHLQEIALI